MDATRRWTDDEGAEGVYHAGRLSIYAKPSMTRGDGVVAVGIDAPWIEELAHGGRAVGDDARCPTCGQSVRVVTGNEGTSYYLKWCDQCDAYHLPPVSERGFDGPDCPRRGT